MAKAKKKRSAVKKTGRAKKRKSSRAKKKSGPTKFQRFLMREGTGAMQKVKAWR